MRILTFLWKKWRRWLDRRRIIGIDPGTTRLGYAVVELKGKDIVDVITGSITFKGTLPDRMNLLYRFLQDLLKGSVWAVAMEDIYSSRNPRASFAVAEVKGIIKLFCSLGGIKVFEYPPAEVKKRISGNGRAGKAQMRRALKFWVGNVKIPDAHSADALAVAIHCVRSLRDDRIS